MGDYRLDLLAGADYTLAGESNYGTGHSRSISVDLGYRFKPYLSIIGGADWGNDYTQEFDMSGNSWRAGVGHYRFDSGFFARFRMRYFRQFNERTSYLGKPDTLIAAIISPVSL